jgi:hypothetical protein
MLREEVDSTVRNWAMWCHLAAFAGILQLPIPFGNILGPAIIWLFKSKSHPYLDEQGREAINFQITMTLGYIIAGVLVLVYIGLLLGPALVIFNIYCVINAAMKARDGYHYKYPFSLKLLHDPEDDL